MRNILIQILISILFFSCSDNKINSDINYDPTKPYPELNPGDSWIGKFDQRGLQNAVLNENHIYCNTIDVEGPHNYLYALNLLTGKVTWKTHVDRYATQPVVFFKNALYYSGFTGNIYKLSIKGELILETESPSSYAGHYINPQNGNLIINTVVDGAYELESQTGKIVHHYYFGKGINHLTSPIFYENQIIFGNAHIDSLNSNREGFISLDYKTKRILWQKEIIDPIKRYHLGPFVVKNFILAIDERNNLHCINVNNGQEHWSRYLLDNRTSDEWSLRAQIWKENFVYHKSQSVILNVDSGKEINPKYDGKIKEYTVPKGNEKYLIEIRDDVWEDELQIKIKE